MKMAWGEDSDGEDEVAQLEDDPQAPVQRDYFVDPPSRDLSEDRLKLLGT